MPLHGYTLIRRHKVRSSEPKTYCYLKANRVTPIKTALMHRLVWSNAGHMWHHCTGLSGATLAICGIIAQACLEQRWPYVASLHRLVWSNAGHMWHHCTGLSGATLAICGIIALEQHWPYVASLPCLEQRWPYLASLPFLQSGQELPSW
ncbi:hypothetical protein DPMN_106334 [Dreissena polymorpha]|uniref:Uncharacterized protein n=1 Tax=Dreissena polymorpha TaxID=45954 RepID=A0A9D4K4S4_DREPO|nr:hypothetical protein DPMN_106334 [Dreissena polymorpha]